MYAVINIGGHQFKVTEGQKLQVNRLDAKEGDKVDFKEVLLKSNDGKVDLGSPFVKSASVSAKIEKHLKSDKVIVFKKKRRKGYKVTKGHRQAMTQIVIEKIA